jgi:hypothetical protein
MSAFSDRSHARFWAKIDGGGAAIESSFNVTGVVDEGTGDITVTIATDFGAATWCCLSNVEMPSDTLSVANARRAVVKFGGQTAGTVRCLCYDDTATTHLVKDPQEWHIAGFGIQ